LEIRYEDLLQDAPGTLGQVLKLLRTSRGDRTIEYCIRAGDFERVSSRQRGEEDSRSFFRKGVAGDWRGVFTERDRDIYEGLAGDQLINMGYGENF
ncbi:MAG: sulfotransferase domain-containing protein, partial [Actinobacteria bacterium]|nr:sulfotransferase domain-containing protein [Actinomycetota bacterium]